MKSEINHSLKMLFMNRKTLNIFIALLIITAFISCKHSQTKTWQANSKAKLQVFYFHSTIRCPTCNAIENITKKVLDESFKTEITNEIINFASFNIDRDENKALIEKYQISYTQLFARKSGWNNN